jgi:lipoprotein NlpD
LTPEDGGVINMPELVLEEAAPPAELTGAVNGKIVYNRKYGDIPKGSYTGGSTYTVKRGDTLFPCAGLRNGIFTGDRLA